MRQSVRYTIGREMENNSAKSLIVATLLSPLGILAFWTYYKAGHVDVKLALLIAVGFRCRGLVRRSLGAAPVRNGAPQEIRHSTC